MGGLNLYVIREYWPIKGKFSISRGVKYDTETVVALVKDDFIEGRGECMPYARYNENAAEVAKALEKMERAVKAGVGREALLAMMPAGAARNALDCALWDYEAKSSGQPVADIINIPPLEPTLTAYTISLDNIHNMADKAAEAKEYPLLKLKLNGSSDDARMRAVREARPDARIIVDANESWDKNNIKRLLQVAKEVGVELVEQPLPAGEDNILEQIEHDVPLCADESIHDRHDLKRVAQLYEAVNIKLDKTGGLTEAMAVMEHAKKLGLKTMVGCMVSTSLAMAPAMIIAQQADWVDLDGPLILAADRTPAIKYENAQIFPPPEKLWG